LIGCSNNQQLFAAEPMSIKGIMIKSIMVKKQGNKDENGTVNYEVL